MSGRAAIGAIAAAAAALAVTTGCGGASHPRRTHPSAPRVSTGSGHRAQARAEPPLVERLTPAQLAGERIVYAYAGLTPPPSLIDRIERGEAAGVIFFESNVASPSQLRAVIDELQRANRQSPVHAPLLMLTDQEGGLVRRLPGAPLASEKEIGAAADGASLARAAGSGAGATLAAAGINVNLAPVLDVAAEPGNFIDATGRSYGADPQRVATLGSAFIFAQQGTGVAATAKHFPGLGDAAANQDTDAEPVTLGPTLATLRTVDEAPYRAAIAAGVKLVMTSWATYPALDASAPAGLSARVIAGELRGRLGFRGVTVTDGLGAGALGGFGGFGDRAVLAARAGADLILCAQPNPDDDTPQDGIAALDALAGALSDGRLDRASFERSVERVIRLRADT